MKLHLVYSFDVIIEHGARRKFLETPIVMKGNKEYYDAYRDMTIYNRMQMMNLYNIGIMALERFHSNNKDKENNDRYWENPKTIAIYRKLIEIRTLLGYSSITGTPGRLSADNKDTLSQVHDIDDIPTTWVLERAFAYEITFLYYLNLNSDISIPRLFPIEDHYIAVCAYILSEKTKQSEEYSLALPNSPRERLTAILRKNRQVKEWFSNCISNCIQFRNAADEVMSAFYRDIN